MIDDNEVNRMLDEVNRSILLERDKALEKGRRGLQRALESYRTLTPEILLRLAPEQRDHFVRSVTRLIYMLITTEPAVTNWLLTTGVPATEEERRKAIMRLIRIGEKEYHRVPKPAGKALAKKAARGERKSPRRESNE